MKKYRILIEQEANGKKWFYAQQRYLLFFWKYLREARDITLYAYKIGWKTLEEADQHIKSEISHTESIKSKKIIKKVIIPV